MMVFSSHYFLVLLALAAPIAAHEHHDQLSEQQANAPVDAILWIHILLQILVWGFLFPIGMVLGITRSRWHVPLQVSLFDSFLLSFFLLPLIQELIS